MSKLTLGILIGVAIGLVGAVWLLRDPIAPLTDEGLAAARRRWREVGPADYEMVLALRGDQAGRYRVEVRQGAVAALARDGQAMRQRGQEWRYWTVEGLFEIIEMDLERKRAAGEAGNLQLSAEFDPRDGRPTRYRRIAVGEARGQSEWRIEEFEPR